MKEPYVITSETSQSIHEFFLDPVVSTLLGQPLEELERDLIVFQRALGWVIFCVQQQIQAYSCKD